MHGDDAGVSLAVERATKQRGSLLDDRVDTLIDQLQALNGRGSWLC
jgi:hypothetical protein